MKFFSLFGIALLISGCAPFAHAGSREKISCGIIFESVAEINSDDLWAIDNAGLVQSDKGSLMRIFFYIDSRRPESIEAQPRALLAFSEKYRGSDIDVVRVSTLGKAQVAQVGIAEHSTGYDFRVTPDFGLCEESFNEGNYYFQINDNNISLYTDGNKIKSLPKNE